MKRKSARKRCRFYRHNENYPLKKVNPGRSGGTKPTGPLFLMDFNKDGWAAGEKNLGGLDESF